MINEPTQKPSSPATEVEEEENGGTDGETGGRKNGLDPTRYGDWELNGRCIDF